MALERMATFTIDNLPTDVATGKKELNDYLGVIKKYPVVPSAKYKMLNDFYKACASLYEHPMNAQYAAAIFCYEQSIAIYNTDPSYQKTDKDAEMLGNSAFLLGNAYGKYLQDYNNAIASLLQAENFYEEIQHKNDNIIQKQLELFLKLADYYSQLKQNSFSENMLNKAKRLLYELIAKDDRPDMQDQRYRQLYVVYYNLGYLLADKPREQLNQYQYAGKALARIKEKYQQDINNNNELLQMIEKLKLDPSVPMSAARQSHSALFASIREKFNSNQTTTNTKIYKP